MPDLKRRALAGLLALALALGAAACSSDDGPPDSSPDTPTTTEPVGS